MSVQFIGTVVSGVWFPFWSGWVFSRPDSPQSHPLPSLNPSLSVVSGGSGSLGRVGSSLVLTPHNHPLWTSLCLLWVGGLVLFRIGSFWPVLRIWNHTHHPPTPSPNSKHSTLPRNPTLLPRFPLSSSGNHSLIHSSIDSNHCSPSLTFVLTCEEIGVICLEV